jgi:hypothetical protein
MISKTETLADYEIGIRELELDRKNGYESVNELLNVVSNLINN